MLNDMNHLGKQNGERAKSAKDILIGLMQFNKTEIALWTCASGAVGTSIEAAMRLNPDDAMDISVIVQLILAIKKIGQTPYTSFPLQFRSQPG